VRRHAAAGSFAVASTHAVFLFRHCCHCRSLYAFCWQAGCLMVLRSCVFAAFVVCAIPKSLCCCLHHATSLPSQTQGVSVAFTGVVGELESFSSPSLLSLCRLIADKLEAHLSTTFSGVRPGPRISIRASTNYPQGKRGLQSRSGRPPNHIQSNGTRLYRKPRFVIVDEPQGDEEYIWTPVGSFLLFLIAHAHYVAATRLTKPNLSGQWWGRRI
jgi:hypothetical protein